MINVAYLRRAVMPKLIREVKFHQTQLPWMLNQKNDVKHIFLLHAGLAEREGCRAICFIVLRLQIMIGWQVTTSPHA